MTSTSDKRSNNEDQQSEVAARSFASLVGISSEAIRFIIDLAFGQESTVTHFLSLFQWDHSFALAVGPLRETPAQREEQLRTAVHDALQRLRPFRLRHPLNLSKEIAALRDAFTVKKGQAPTERLRAGDMLYLRYHVVHDRVPESVGSGLFPWSHLLVSASFS